MIPKIVTNWSVSINGKSHLGNCEKLTLPAVKPIKEEIAGCGWLSKRSVVVGMEKMVAKFVFHSISEEVFYGFALGHDIIMVTAKAALGTGANAEPLTAVLHGNFDEIEPLEFEAMKATGKFTCQMDVTRFVVTKNGLPLMAADVDNQVFSINGIDKFLTKNLI